MGRCGRSLGAAALVVVVSCSPRGPAPLATPPVTGRSTVAVLPFRVSGELDPGDTFRIRSDLPPVPDGIGDRMAETLSLALARNGVEAIAPSVVLGATPPPGAARYDTALAARIAATVGATYAVIGALTRYVEREGSAWGTSVPATVWYQAALVDAATAAVVERQRFEYTQRPLSENLLDLPRFLKGGARWVTREEMLTDALDDTAARLAGVVRNPPVNP